MGCAEASRYRDREPDEVTLVTAGEGATSEGEFWEVAQHRLPRNGCRCCYLIEDNGYAISVPVEVPDRRAATSRELVAGFPGLFRQEVDGTDFLASLPRDAARRPRIAAKGSGPALVHAHVIRPYSHSLSDDERLYKTAAEREAEAAARSGAALSPSC